MKIIKNLFALVGIILIFNTWSYAQIKFIGGSLGLNLSKLNYKDDLSGYDFNFRNGFRGGLFVEYQLANEFLIHTEINYTMRGTEYGLDEMVSDGLVIPKHKFIQKLGYVEIPFLFQYNILIESNIKPNVFIGPEISFLLNAKTEYVENDISKNEVDEKDHLKSSEYGVVLGIGVDYNLDGGKFLFDVRYYLGISNINKVETSKIFSSTLSFNMGFGFLL